MTEFYNGYKIFVLVFVESFALYTCCYDFNQQLHFFYQNKKT